MTSAVQKKIWGHTQSLLVTPYSETHILSIKGGFVCSKHSHRKWNRFYLISGKLKVKLFKTPDGEPYEEYLLSSGEYVDVRPNVIHQFECVEDAQCVEVYWVDELKQDDITRHELGHKVAAKKSNAEIDAECLKDIERFCKARMYSKEETEQFTEEIMGKQAAAPTSKGSV